MTREMRHLCVKIRENGGHRDRKEVELRKRGKIGNLSDEVVEANKKDRQSISK